MKAKVKVYEYPKCSTCQKALKFLTAHEVPVERVDITQTPPSKGEIEQMLTHYDGEVRKLFNTSGLVYREMGLGEKLKGMSPKEAIGLLASNGRLIKRPFVLHGGKGRVGFREAEWKMLFS